MGNGIVERTGHLFIIILGVVILVIVGWGFGAPPGETGTDPGPIQSLAAIEGDGQSRPSIGGASAAANPWPPVDDRRETARVEPVVRPVEPVIEEPVVPVVDDRAPVPPPPSRDLEHVIAKKETFYSVAAKYYRDGKLWPIIAQANPGVDPNDLTVGMTIRIPDPDRVLARDAPDRDAATAAVPSDIYVVQEGDNLWKIAVKTHGNGAYSKKILDANPDVLTGNGENIHAGMKLKLPPR
jgi:nucleoid-associated protein YgaU